VADLELLDLLLGLRPLLARRGSHLLELLVLLAAGGLEREERLLGRLDLLLLLVDARQPELLPLLPILELLELVHRHVAWVGPPATTARVQLGLEQAQLRQQRGVLVALLLERALGHRLTKAA
jgi:hypothetical protein